MKKKLLKIFIICATLILLLIVAGYFLVTSEIFIKAIVIPRMASILGMRIDVASIDLSPLSSRFSFKNLSVGPTKTPLIKIGSAACDYDIWDLIQGEITINRLTIDSTHVSLIRHQDGTFNLPSFVNSQASRREQEKPQSSIESQRNSELPLLNISNVDITNFNLSTVLKNSQRRPDTKINLKNLNIKLPKLKNGQDFSLSLQSDLNALVPDALTLESQPLSCEIQGSLSKNLSPESLRATLKATNLNGSIKGKRLKSRTLTLNLNLKNEGDTYKIQQCELTDKTDQSTVSNIALSGSLTPKPLSTNLAIKIAPVSSTLLNTIGETLFDVNFGKTNVSYDGSINYSPSQGVHAQGEFSAFNLSASSLIDSTQHLTPCDAHLSHDFTINSNSRIANLKEFQLSLTPSITGDSVHTPQKPIVELTLEHPCQVSWKDDTFTSSASSTSFNLLVNQLNLKEFSMFMPCGTTISGIVDAAVNGTLKASEKRIFIENTLKVSDFGLKNDDFELKSLSFVQKSNLALSADKNLTINQLDLDLLFSGRRFLHMDTKGNINLNSLRGDTQIAIDIDNSTAAAAFPQVLREDAITKSILDSATPGEIDIKMGASLDLANDGVTAETLRFLLKKPEKQFLEVVLRKPLPVYWKNGVEDLEKSHIAATLAMRDFGIPDGANPYIPTSTGFSISSGLLDLDWKVDLSLLADKIKIDGPLTIKNTNLSFKTLKNASTQQGKDEKTPNSPRTSPKETILGVFDLKAETHVNYDDYLELTTRPFVANIKVDGKTATRLESRGKINFYTFMGESEFILNELNQQALLLLDKEKPIISELNMTGSVKSKFESLRKFQSIGTFDVASLVPASKKSSDNADKKISFYEETYKGEIAFDIVNLPNTLMIKKVLSDIHSEKKFLLNLHIAGDIPLPFDSGPTRLNFNSKGIDAKAIESLFFDSRKSKKDDEKENKKDQPEAGKEPEPNDLGGLTLISKLNLQNITYGDALRSELKAQVNVEKGLIQINPFQIDINQTPIDCDFMLDMRKSNGYPFKLSARFADLDLVSIIRAFHSKLNKNLKGVISSLDFNTNGKGFTSENLRRNLCGKLESKIKNISVPYSLIESPETQFVFVPLRALANIQQWIPTLATQKGIMSASKTAREILSDTRHLELDDGEINVIFDGSEARLIHCDFTGFPIRRLAISGNFGLIEPYRLDVATRMNLSRVIIPIRIKGSIYNPDPDYKIFVAAFLKENAMNMLDPANIKDLLEGAKGNTENVVKKIGSIMLGLDKKKKKKKDDTLSESDSADREKLNQSINKIIDTFNEYIK